MLMVDMHNTTARISLAEIEAGGSLYVSDAQAFARFMAGMKFTPGMLLDQSWRNSGGVANGSPYFGSIMQFTVPRIYDVRHLENLGGRFALRIIGGGDFTVIALNRRVVTLSGLPLNEAGEPVFDAELRGDAFMGLCNDMLANVAEATLARIGAARVAAAA